MLFIGSWALRHHGIEVNRPVYDIDIICTEEEFREYVAQFPNYTLIIDNHDKKVLDTGTLKIEFDIARCVDSNSQLLSMLNATSGVVYAPLFVLLLLKESHKYKKDSPHFRKTMLDIKLLRGMVDKEQIPDEWWKWYKEREKETYHYSHPNLNQSKAGFFNTPNVEYRYDHDDIHRAVSIDSTPAYTKYLVDEVRCSKELFNKLSYEERLQGVMEESCVLALERCLIPYGFKEDPFKVYTYALQKVCTSITSGWFREWAWENFDEAIKQYPKDYVEKFNSALLRGEVGGYNG